MKNPFDGFYHVPTSQELLDIAFRRAMKSSASVSKNAPILIKAKKKEARRIKVAIKQVIDRILQIIKRVPRIQELPEFYKELASIVIDVDKLRLTLGKLNGILPVLSKIEREHYRRLGRIEEPKEADQIRRSCFGRVSSIVNKQDGNLRYLNSIRGDLRALPSIDYETPVVVFAGAPNVGKSSLVKQISTNKRIEVQEYPFTTKKLALGHYKVQQRFETRHIQIMDTPGILDRPMSERNRIERQAILALRLIADLIFFVFDPTPSSGYSVESQIKLFRELKDKFIADKDIETQIIFNKMDFASQKEIKDLAIQLEVDSEDFVLTNALKGENINKLKTLLDNKFASKESLNF
ncbi:MAG: NOG1 family protein [Promethearchaeia archaeon]